MVSHDRKVDCLVIGAGHNGLVTAAYLARAGLRVVVLEASERVGGAAISAEVFPGMPARLSKYSYLVSLLPKQIASDLDIDVTLARRQYASYTPDPMDPRKGLLIPAGEDQQVSNALAKFTGHDSEGQAWVNFYQRTTRVAQVVFASLLDPLVSEREMQARFDDDDWRCFAAEPLGRVIESTFNNDVVRGVVLTDALIGTFADANDATLQQNICFLYHVIGQGTGQWDVPIGGMGAITGQLANRVRQSGGEIRTEMRVTSIVREGSTLTVQAEGEHGSEEWQARTVAAGCARYVLDSLRGESVVDIDAAHGGSQLKVNMLLARLPALRDPSVSPAAAFSGTFHVNESYEQLSRAYQDASSGGFPEPLPAEIYCHTLSDGSIVSPELRDSGVHTLTLFGLHTPHRLFEATSPPTTRELINAVSASLDSVLGDSLEECLLLDGEGKPCIEVNTTMDLQRDLALPAGNIFHDPLQWPWATSRDHVGRWGVETDDPALVVCGSSAVRGGGVSGIPGHNAAQYLLKYLT